MEIQLPLGRHNLNLSIHEGDFENKSCPENNDSFDHNDDFYREVFCRDYEIGKFHFHVGIWFSGADFASRF